MDFTEGLKALGEKAEKLRANLTTEEATKTALVLPFIKELGYDIFSPLEVVPEFIADVPGMKGEKVDYAIMHEGSPAIMIECKCCGTNLDDVKKNQLHRYFITQNSVVAILTDGIRYLFFSKKAGDNNIKMEEEPFMEFSLDNIDPTLIPELRKLCKGKFDLKSTLDTVNELKFNRKVKNTLIQNLSEPQESFVTFFMREASIKPITKNAIEQHTNYVKRAFNEFVAEQVDGRLKTALAATSKKEEAPEMDATTTEPEITEFEWHAFYLVKSILAGHVDSDRVVLLNQSGIGRSVVVLDGNSRKPVVRFNFANPSKIFIEIGPANDRVSYPIAKVDDILPHAEAIRAVARAYDARAARKVEPELETSA